MKKKNGFVFMETIVVVSILSLTLILLYSSYAHILGTSKERKTFDTTEGIYRTYYVKKALESFNPTSSTALKDFFNTSYCKNLTSNGVTFGKSCDIGSTTTSQLQQIRDVFEVDKVYLISPYQILSGTNSTDMLMQLDATTIDYVRRLGKGVGVNNGVTQYILIVKYVYKYNNTGDTYEVFHASMEV
ncbi:MAG TPA: hypothetical protein PKG93_04875 [Bacilli bacterium]|nr:hypothetical protein [Bacilli bacterium]